MEMQLVRFPQASALPSLWAEAGCDVSAYGSAFDRVFGEGERHLLGYFAPEPEAILTVDDPLVTLTNFIDGVSLPMGDTVSLPTPEFTAIYDFTAGPDGLPPHDLWVIDT